MKGIEFINWHNCIHVHVASRLVECECSVMLNSPFLVNVSGGLGNGTTSKVETHGQLNQNK